MAEQPPHDDNTRAIRARAGESPTSIDLPFWVDACLALDPPRKSNGSIRSGRYSIYPVARALMADRINARGDEAVHLNRDALARWAGHSHARNCGWIFGYLERIGFLMVNRHPAASGQEPDTFDVFVTPPDNYVGPQSYAELDMALAHDRPHMLFSSQPGNRRSEPNSAHTEVDSEPNSAHTEMGPGNRRSEPNSAHTEVDSEPNSAHTEMGPGNRRSEPNSAHTEVDSEPLNLSSFLPDEGRKEGRNEGVGDAPRGGAGDAAPESDDDELTAHVRDLVRRLPWAKAPVGRTASVMTEANQRLVPAIVTAIREHELTLNGARDHALARWAKVKTVGFLVGAFEPKHLALPEPADVLAMPERSSTGEQDQAVFAEQQSGGEPVSPWCGDCIGLRTENGKTCSADCTTGETTSADVTGGMPDYVRAERTAQREQDRLDRIRRKHGYSA